MDMIYINVIYGYINKTNDGTSGGSIIRAF
nr:MAG TPA: hypothetical protein [Caudoviricetes sp.]